MCIIAGMVKKSTSHFVISHAVRNIAVISGIHFIHFFLNIDYGRHSFQAIPYRSVT